jgi:hypothetical protein
LIIVGTLFALKVRIKRGGLAGCNRTVKRPMKILILMALFCAIAAAYHRRDPGEQPKPAA